MHAKEGIADERVTIQVISTKEELLQNEHVWNALVSKYSNNPFLLTEFSKRFMEHIWKGWTPMILIISINQTIIGIAPLKTKRNLIGRHADFLHPFWCSEFVFDEQYKDICVKVAFDFLFTKLKCNYASFTLPSDSSNIQYLIQRCKLDKIHLENKPELGQRIIPVTSTWSKYEASRTTKFRKEIRRTERNLNKTGLWTAIYVEGTKQKDITRKVYTIEKKSWKENWRNQKGEQDWILSSVIEAAPKLVNLDSNFKCGCWFLELEGKPIAYALTIEYKKVAYIVKTSFDEQYKRFYPGIIVQNFAIQQLFTSQQTKYIDFILDLSYQQVWTNVCLPRVTLQLTKGAIPTLMHFIIYNRFVSKIITAMAK